MRRESGMVLLVSLVFMLLLTIVAGGAMQSATMQERMAGNTKEVNLAFQAAEAGLREGESALAGVTVGPFNGSNGMYQSCPDPTDTSTACSRPSWENYTSSGWVTIADFDSRAAKQPEYIIEEMSSVLASDSVLDSDRVVPSSGYYRVIARGYGASDRSMVVLTTTYKRED